MLLTNLIKRSTYFFSQVSKFDHKKNYYNILGVNTNADQKEIKKSFRDLAKKYHPDSNSGNENKFKEINEAYQVLSSNETKREYDQVRSYNDVGGDGGYGDSFRRGGTNANSYQNHHYNQQHHTQQSNHYYEPNYGKSAHNQHNANYSNTSGQSFYEDLFQQAARKNFHSQYRGYTQSSGWENQQTREEILREIHQKQQQSMHNAGREHFGSFSDMYKSKNAKVRQCNMNTKETQEKLRKAYMEEAERLYKEYEDKSAEDLKEKIDKTVTQIKEGITKNIEGGLKLGEYLKSKWNSFKEALEDTKKNDSGKKK